MRGGIVVPLDHRVASRVPFAFRAPWLFEKVSIYRLPGKFPTEGAADLFQSRPDPERRVPSFTPALPVAGRTARAGARSCRQVRRAGGAP